MYKQNIYYYVHTGHRIGLDRFRRACTILSLLKDVDITLLCSDYRIAQAASEFGVEKSVGIDVVRNIPQIAYKGDKLIFDSDEANPTMLKDMKEFFSSFLHIDNEMIVIDDKYFKIEEKTIEMSLFFGDDDYEKDLQKNFSFFDGLDLYLQLGFYYFLDYEDMLREKFPNHFEFEEYDEMIRRSKILITPSPQAVLQNLASGGKPIYIQREDYTTAYQKVFEKLNIPIIKEYSKEELSTILETIDSRKYYNLQQNSSQIYKFIKYNLSL
ncbi:MAG: hypothetical protein JJW00_03140 [Sulfurimonas sp.]|nr:hypothetical protein [Sulfurimonas sp.]